MSKISKFIICCIAVIISIVSLCVPTYCATQYVPDDYYSISLGSFDQSNNFYNQNSLKYVNMKNFNLSRSNGLVLTCKLSATNGDMNDLIGRGYRYTKDIYISHYATNQYYIGTLVVDYYINIDKSTKTLDISQTGYSFTPNNNVLIPLNSSSRQFSSIRCSIEFIPFSFINQYFYNVTSLSDVFIFNSWNITWEYDYNNQYFYNNYFGINFQHRVPFWTVQWDYLYLPNIDVTLIDNNDYIFTETFNQSNDFYSANILFHNNFNYNSSYIVSVDYKPNYDYIYFNGVSKDYFDRYYFSDNYTFSSPIPDSTYTSNTLYSSNSLAEDSLGSSVIPIGSNNYYKAGEWWDIPTHLYNFFIYLIFDAPIISNFTKLVMVIINFIIELFEFFIGLFSGVENIFFISIFVGIVVLIFLLKIIFKG